MSNPVNIRGHHLETLAYVRDLPREEHAKNLMEFGYVRTPEDPFVDLSGEQFLALFQDPNRQFRVVANKLDFICDGCPKRLSGTCDPTRIDPPEYIPSVFLEGWDPKDVAVAKDLGLKIGGVYTARELLERLGLQL